MSDKTENQFKQQPVAWMYEKPAKDGFSELTLSFGYEPEFDGIIRPLFVESNLKRQPLSNDAIAKLLNVSLAFVKESHIDRLVTLIRKVEKAHEIGE